MKAVPCVCEGVKLIPSRAMMDIIKVNEVGVTLNPEARFVFEQINGVRSIAAIVDRMAEVYDAPPKKIAADVVDMLVEIEELGLITLTYGGDYT